MKVNYLNFERQNQFYKKNLLNECDRFFDSNSYILGQELTIFEKEFAHYTKSLFSIGVGSGFSAIQLVLSAWKIGDKDEVLIAANSYIAAAMAISQQGATPIFVDDQESNFCMDQMDLEHKITKNTKAIICTHLYGIPEDMDKVLSLAKKYDLKVLEDAAQAHGSFYKDQPCGSLADAAIFSFYPTKNLGGYGDGGAITTNNVQLHETLMYLRNYGSKEKHGHQIIGFNSRLDEIQARFLSIKLTYLDEMNKKREKLARIYLKRLSSCQNITLPYIPENKKTNWHVFPILLVHSKLRDKLFRHLKNLDITCHIHYPTPIHKQNCFLESSKEVSLMNCEKKAKSLISLPLDPFHSEEEIHYVADSIYSFFESNK